MTDAKHKILYAPVQGQLRVAAFADLVGYDTAIQADRLATLHAQTTADFPCSGDFKQAKVWAGLRPATPTGLPITEASSTYRNLWLNVGHGPLGFTLACGSAQRLSAAIAIADANAC